MRLVAQACLDIEPRHDHRLRSAVEPVRLLVTRVMLRILRWNGVVDGAVLGVRTRIRHRRWTGAVLPAVADRIRLRAIERTPHDAEPGSATVEEGELWAELLAPVKIRRQVEHLD